jgi:hypothetical protein
MRYVIAIIFAIAGAALAMIFVSQGVADFMTARYRFDSPDEVADLHSGVYMACNVLGLILGWLTGWGFGGMFARGPKAL